MSSLTLQESGITCEFPKEFQQKLGSQWPVAKKLSTARTFSFLALSKLVDELYAEGSTPLSSIEAVPGVGLAGILWKKVFKEKVNVTINSLDEYTAKIVEENAQKNSVATKDLDITHQDCNALLHSHKKLNFIYLEAYGTSVKYLESAFHVICHRGIICIVSTDLSTLYNKSPSRVQRIYHGNTMKNEYIKEMSIRLILANVVRAASRWDRGISVLSSYMDDNSIVVLVRALKGATHADKLLDSIQKVYHCRVCHYRYMVNEKLHYNPQPDIVDCMCVDSGNVHENVLPPIVILGPVYSGPIFEMNFLLQTRKSLLEFDSESKLAVVLRSMIVESQCFNSDELETQFLELLDKDTKQFLDTNTEQEPAAKKGKLEECASIDKFLQHHANTSCPVFFYIPQTYTKGGFNPPKLPVVIQKLRSKGFKACKTIFDPRGLRTSASSKQFYKIVNDIATETASQPCKNHQ